MRAFRFLNLAILSMLVGCSALVYSQDDKQPEDKPARQEEPKPQPKQDEMKPPRQDEAKPSKPEMKDEKQQQKEEQKDSHDQMKPEQQAHPEQQARPEQQAEHARPTGKSARIPDDKFRAHFGHEHTFRAQTVIVQDRPQFQYGGYSFNLVDVWPQDWAYTDDCYIDYIDGEYFLFDLLHPGVRIAVFVVM
jgi:cell division protein FtsN